MHQRTLSRLILIRFLIVVQLTGIHVSNAQTTCPKSAIDEGEPCGFDSNGSCIAISLCGGASGDCCTAGDGPGCEDLKCQDAICAIDPFCCDVGWDGICAAAACADDLNCQCEPQKYPDISCGDTMCGTFWALSNFRDVDFYRFQTTGGRIQWRVQAQWPAQAYILNGNCPPQLIAQSVTCIDELIATAILDAGEYTVFVSTLEFDGLPCNTGMNEYVATLTCEPCYSDITRDSITDTADLLQVIDGWGSCDDPACDCVPDVNGDLNVDVDDLLALINHWGDC